ncbi:MAG: glycoside hydrolase family 55 protein [Cyanobacteria bacterium J06635_11]
MESHQLVSQQVVPADAKGMDIRDYGAIPNDGKDDTAAIQKALDDGRRDASGKPLHDDFNGRSKFLYLPKGTYDISDTLDWVGASVTLNGDGDETILKLKDNAEGFGNVDAPKALLKAPNGNMSFRQNIRNLSVNTGRGNAGALGIDYNSSNVGSMQNVTITSGDGKGHTGLAMYDGLPGPLLVKNVKVTGFDTGIGVASGEYGVVLKDIELSGQNKRGISVGGGMVTAHGLTSNNTVPVIEGDAWHGMVTLVDGDFRGGSAEESAIATQGQLYARNVKTSGYQSALKAGNKVIPGSTIGEYSSDTDHLFDNSAQKSLNLPIKDIPDFHDDNLDNWGRFEPRWYGDTAGLQDLLNSGKSTIYFPAGIYFSHDRKVVEVPPTVRKIVGFSSTVNGGGKDGGGIKFVVKGDSQAPLIVEGFGYGVKVENQASRDVVLKNGKYKYTDGPGASDLYLEDVGMDQLELTDTRNVYAWQLNTESLDEARTKVINSGANMVVFGIKTEGKGTVIETVNGGKTEVLGGFILPVQAFSAEEKKDPAFSSVDSELSLSLRFRHYENSDKMYDTLVQETRNGETRQFKSSGSPHQYLSLYSGNQTAGASPAEKTPLPQENDPVPNAGQLVSHLKLDETSGQVANDSSPEGLDNPGTLAGDAGWTDGAKQGAAAFDGSGDAITLQNSKNINLTKQGQRTVSLWFRATDTASSKQVLFEEGAQVRGLNIYLDQSQLYVGGWNTPGKESGWQGTWLSTDKLSFPGVFHPPTYSCDWSR